jgi:1-acyl-sn-glycerol-3-phosphate acyltransferase
MRFASIMALRRVEVAGRSHIPAGRPVLVVSNHFNGVIDPVVLTVALRQLPRFIAKDGLAKLPVVGFFLRWAGVVFVHRQVDRGSAPGNTDAFRECHEALRKADVVAIFPEGTTHDRPRMDPIKTGAARIALGARAAGATGVVILPIGLTFPDKIALRVSALVQIGLPIELDDAIAPGVGPDDHEAVRHLTATIDAGLRDISPNFPDVETAIALDQAAHIALTSVDRPDRSLVDRYALARYLGTVAEHHQQTIRREVGRYNTILTGLSLTDEDVIRPTNPARLFRSIIIIATIVALLGGLVAATAIVNVWPAGLVVIASSVVKTPVSKGTVRIIVGLVAFPTAWIIAGVLGADGFVAGLLLALTSAAGAVAAIWLVERAIALSHMLMRWRAQRERIGTVEWTEPVRADLVAAVSAASPEDTL